MTDPASPKLPGAEMQRLADDKAGHANWRRWGPYLSERQWGTVREDYSANGDAWQFLNHEQSRSRAYRWSEDGLAGFSDDRQFLCLSLALWNGRDPILKERLFGLTNSEGNHGEDVKELYYYLDATPSHSYLKMLYKYPQGEFPYARLVEENRRGPDQPEFELLDTGLFDEDRYFDVFVEYAKAGPDDLLLQITAYNRGPEAAPLWLVPQAMFRNTWSWKANSPKPHLAAESGGVKIEHHPLGNFRLAVEGTPRLLFCDNDTNAPKLYGQSGVTGFFKDAFHEAIVHGREDTVNPAHAGTKVGVVHQRNIPAGSSATVRLRLTKIDGAANGKNPWSDFDALMMQRRAEADEYYAALQAEMPDDDARLVQRQAYAGMIWSKQFFHYDVDLWLRGDPAGPTPPAERKSGRNAEWRHVNNSEIISMPDKWEYPWFAAWDLAFHCVTFAGLDPEFAKGQLLLLAREWYMHPNGQLPAYEWSFSDVNPPVHAWAAFRVYKIDLKLRRDYDAAAEGDVSFLKRIFQKLLLNFTWWVNRKDEQGRNIFQGGFLGLDNIGCFDRSKPLPSGGFINQADGTSWMAMYCLNMLRISLELAQHDHTFEDIASKFFEHFLAIADAINGEGENSLGLWDEGDQFYYDHLNLPDGQNLPLKIHSLVGLIPLLAVEVLDPATLDRLPEFTARMDWYLKHRAPLAGLVSNWQVGGAQDRRLFSLLRGSRMKALLRRMLDETQFLSPQGVRSVSKENERAPFRFESCGQTYEVAYWPGESHNRLFGGNSNWRGPIWMPINYLIVEALQRFHHYYGDDFKIECPTGSGIFLTIKEVAQELAHRLASLFLKGPDGQRPVLKYHPKLAADPHFKDYVLFHEYFHGDTGRGVGASHQTGWTGLVARLLRPRRAPAPSAPKSS